MLALAVAATLGLDAAYAAQFGRARVLSGTGQPLRVELPIGDLAAGQGAQNLTLTIDAGQAADAALNDRAPLTVRNTFESRADGAAGVIAVITSSAVVTRPVVDLAVRLQTPEGEQRRRVVLLLRPALQAAVSPVSLARPTAPAAPETITVRRGDTLGGIGRRLASRSGYDSATLYQVLAALLQANPSAFIDGNMNRLRAGARLQIPDAAAVSRMDAAEARRLYARHMEGLTGYRERVAQSAGQVSAAEAGAAEGRIQAGATPAPPPVGKDELRISSAANVASGVSGQAAIEQLMDERTATQRAIADARARVGELEGNVAELERLLQIQNSTLARLQSDESQAEDGNGATGAPPNVADGTSADGAVGNAAGGADAVKVAAEAGGAGDSPAGATAAGATNGAAATPAGTRQPAVATNGTPAASGAAPAAPGNAGVTAAAAQDGFTSSASVADDDPSWRERYFWPLLVLVLAAAAWVLYRVFRRSPDADGPAAPPPLDVDFDLDLKNPPPDGPSSTSRS